MQTDAEIKDLILHKLFMRRCWGAKHTSFENLDRGFKPQELGKKGYKRIMDMGKDLIRENLLLSKPTYYGLEVSLNPKQKDIILNKIKRFFET
ncbi:MAG: hypothetical protein NTW30_03335 [Candidatus Aenigmarchaeota archaeon]|nr:hypothetical protein [Candidatus Aenigmarchaeota archaeon]